METSPTPARTLGYEESSAAAAATLLQPVQAGTGFDATALAVESGAAAFAPPPGATRTTVLPRVEGGDGEVQLHAESKLRYEPLKLLGAGGMGEVVLVEDQDIARRVAVKRLLPELTHPSILARFVDEIRTVGRLEHPNIVPIHDVGIDDLGRYFFVMKYVEGETLESVIEKLAAGDPTYVARYSYEQRIELFLGVLHALEYAHEHGVVHRDIKPANVMIGRYGEVVLMDWGIAKPLDLGREPAGGAEGAIGAEGEGRARAFATRVGSLIGTPAYMSPEQARGDNKNIDARSDLYSAAVMFHELIGLRHYLFDAPTMEAMIASVISEPHGFFKVLLNHHPNHPTPPGELAHFVAKGIEKDPALRFQSARQMIDGLQEILQGKVQVQCHITFTKRSVRELGRLVDRSPHAVLFALVGVLAAVVFAVVTLVRVALA